MRNRKFALGLAVAALGIVMAGCNDDPLAGITPATPPPTTTSTAPPYEFKGNVGVPLDQSKVDPTAIQKEVASHTVNPRPNPFALLPQERAFDQSQRAEYLLDNSGGFSTMYEPPAEADQVEEAPEPQPYRRLAGILVGDTVSAILIMEDGTPYIIKPGMRIPNSEWRVVSIDEDKAVLRRAGKRKPTQIVIRLETPPGGVPGVQGGPGPRGGGPGGAGVGGPPPGVQGIPGRGGPGGGVRPPGRGGGGGAAGGIDG